MSTGLLPDRLLHLAEEMALPAREELRLMAENDLLVSFLKRKLLEGLAEQVEETLPQDDDLAVLAEHLGMPSGPDPEQWRSALAIPLDRLRSMATFPRRLWAATEEVWGDTIPSRFLERRADLDQVVLSLVRFKDPDLAQELYFQLKEGELSFGEMVERHATEADQLRRGLLGPMPIRRLNPLLAKVVERYPERALIPPIDLDGTVHLIRVETVQRAELNEGTRERLLLDQRNRWLADQLKRLQRRILETKAAAPSNPPPAA